MWRGVGRFLLTGALLSLPFAAFFALLNGGAGHWFRFAICYAFSASMYISIGLLMRVFRYVVVPRLRPAASPPRGRAFALELAVCALFSILGSQLLFLLATVLFHLDWFYHSWRSFLVNLGFSLIFTVLFSGVIYAQKFYQWLLMSLAAEERARTELARAQVKAIRAQIHPHFLFNTLNTIAALIPSEPAVAEEVTTRLAEVFRFVLRAPDREAVTLAEELEFTRAYLDIERVRLGERLGVEEDIDPSSLSVEVPTLLLQPLVENAVRHGLAPRPAGGTLRIRTSMAGGALTLAVTDDGNGFDAGAVEGRRGEGFGRRGVLVESPDAAGGGERDRAGFLDHPVVLPGRRRTRRRRAASSWPGCSSSWAATASCATRCRSCRVPPRSSPRS